MTRLVKEKPLGTASVRGLRRSCEFVDEKDWAKPEVKASIEALQELVGKTGDPVENWLIGAQEDTMAPLPEPDAG